MYCPRCDRTLKRENIERVNEELKSKFDRDSLEHGRCPVCSTQLIDLAKKGGK
ncbi:MAG: hypothetical protein GX307_00325 [Euryarchaeota archaeon]|nr:hypothetical protein [Euryarchaeota archaeon]